MEPIPPTPPHSALQKNLALGPVIRGLYHVPAGWLDELVDFKTGYKNMAAWPATTQNAFWARGATHVSTIWESGDGRFPGGP